MTNTNSTNHPTTTNQRRSRSMLGFASGIAATLLAGTVFAAVTTNAAPVDGESTFVPISPCRVLDTRPAPDNVGARSTPLGADETHVQAIGGTNGNCTLPEKISGVAINATALNATSPTFVTFGPAGEATPDTSNLNVLPNQPPTPNKVDVKLSEDGEVAVYNAFGAVDLIIDITGYYRSSGLADMEKALSVAASSITELRDTQPFVGGSTDSFFFSVPLFTQNKDIMTLGIPEGFKGDVLVNYTLTVEDPTEGDSTRCTLSLASETMGSNAPTRFESAGASGSAGVMAGNRVYAIDGQSEIFVVCNSDNNAFVSARSITGTFFPTP